MPLNFYIPHFQLSIFNYINPSPVLSDTLPQGRGNKKTKQFSTFHFQFSINKKPALLPSELLFQFYPPLHEFFFRNMIFLAEIGFGMPMKLWKHYFKQKGEENAKNENSQVRSKTLQSYCKRQNYEKTSRHRPLAPTQVSIKKTQNFQDG